MLIYYYGFIIIQYFCDLFYTKFCYFTVHLQQEQLIAYLLTLLYSCHHPFENIPSNNAGSTTKKHTDPGTRIKVFSTNGNHGSSCHWTLQWSHPKELRILERINNCKSFPIVQTPQSLNVYNSKTEARSKQHKRSQLKEKTNDTTTWKPLSHMQRKRLPTGT